MRFIWLDERRRIVAYLDGLPPIGDLRQAKVNALPALSFSGRFQSASGEELRPLFGRTLMLSVLDKVFKVYDSQTRYIQSLYSL
jgi:hypothetical protein